MRRILLTGAGKKSFIGRSLKEMLSEQYEVFAPSHAALDLLDFDAVQRYTTENKIEVLVHSAIHVPIFNGAADEYINDMRMFLHLEKVSRDMFKMIYFGSGAEFDKRYDITMVKEESFGKTIPITDYGFAKYTMNTIARHSKNIYNLRLFGIFGPYELYQYKFISNLCCRAVLGLPIKVRQDCNFDFIYIDDLHQPVQWCIEGSPSYRDYNLCHGTPYRLTEIAAMVKEVAGISQETIVISEGNNLDYTANNARLVEDMNHQWKITPLYNAVEKLYKYYYDNKSLIDHSIL